MSLSHRSDNSPPGSPRDRAVGALLGLAVGDAIGTTLEFAPRDSRPPLTGMTGGGPFALAPGQWTDDTAMALCLAQSLLHCGGLDEADLMARFCRWWREGENSCTGRCFDIGNATQSALARFERTGEARAGLAFPSAAGNGSLMRLAPVALRWHRDRDGAAAAAHAQSLTTHGSGTAAEACAYFCHLLLDAIEGRPVAEVIAPRDWSGDPQIRAIAQGTWRMKDRDAIPSSGYVVHTLEAALWSVARARDFRDAVLTAANLGGDADTVAAVAGQLSGALWGASAIPEEWRTRLAWHDHIAELAGRLFEAGAPTGTEGA